MPLSDEILPPAPLGSDPPKRKKKYFKQPATDAQLDEGYGVNSRGEDRFKIRYQRPEVAAHYAKVLVANAMDWEAATATILQAAAKANGWDPPTDEAIARHAGLLRKAAQIQKAIRQRCDQIGLGDDAQKLYVSHLWGYFLDRSQKNDTRWTPTMKQLGIIMQLDKKVDYDKKPQPLTLLGAGPLLARMGIPVNDNIDLEVDDAGTDERSEPEETEGDSLEAAEPAEADDTEQ